MSLKRSIDEVKGSTSSEVTNVTNTKTKEDDNTNDESKKKKMTLSFNKKPSIGLGIKPVKAINIKLGTQKGNVTTLKAPLQNIFNSDSDEEEEMPREAKMRMRNIGRETPTSAGPNSFGKTKQGFCDAKYMFEKKLKEATLEHSEKLVKKY